MSDPFDAWLQGLRSDLNARWAESARRIQELKAAVVLYERACSEAQVYAYAAASGLKRPAPPAPTPEAAAASLLTLVRALPGLTRAPAPEPPALPQTLKATPPPDAPAPATQAAGLEPLLPNLTRELSVGPLVIVGGMERREQLAHLPPNIRASVEWVETSRQGTHAIGNLATRIRQRRLAGLILMEGTIGHKHSDPLIAAARDAGIAAAYAGKGGQAALRRAVLQIERMLSTSTPAPAADG